MSADELRHILTAVEEHSVNRLIDPETRRPHASLASVNDKLTEIRQAIVEVLRPVQNA